MRVSSQSVPNALSQNLQRLMQRQFQLQTETATGKKTDILTEQPSALGNLLRLENTSQATAQFKRNAEHAYTRSQENIDAIRALKTLSDRAGEIAIKANSLAGSDALASYAIEIDQLLEDALAQSNRKTDSGYAFAGTRSDQAPFIPERDAEGKITSVSYQGNQNLAETDIAPGSSVTSAVVGANTGTTGPSGLFVDQRSGADLFGHLVALRDHLASGDMTTIQSSVVADLAADEENFLLHLSSFGALQTRIETTQARHQEQDFSVATQKSAIVDADLAKTIVSLNQAQTSYQAALQSGAQLLSTSLMDYLR